MGQPSAGLELQVGKEATNAWGTAVAPTAKLMKVTSFSINPLDDVQIIDELSGTLQPSSNTIIQRKGAEATLDGLLTYEDAPYLFDAMFHHSDTDGYLATDASADGKWSYDSPIESTDITDPRVMTYVYGDGTYIWGFNGGTARELSFNFASGEPVSYTLDLFGKSITSDTFGAATDRAVDLVMGHHGHIWIDPDSNAAGTTAVSDVMFSGSMSINSNRTPIHHLEDLSPSGFQDHVWGGTLSLVLELNATTEAYIKSIVEATTAGIGKNVRLKFTSDSDYVQLDFGGTIVDQPEIFEDADGVITLTLNLEAKPSEGMTPWFQGEIFNHVVALT